MRQRKATPAANSTGNNFTASWITINGTSTGVEEDPYSRWR